MATKRFCDICDLLLTVEDDTPYTRKFHYGENLAREAVGHIMIVNEQNHALTDVCIRCKLKVVNEGDPIPIATLQQHGSGGISSAPPALPVHAFEPSLKTKPEISAASAAASGT